MSNTIITLNKEYFTAEISQNFLKEIEKACLTMEVEDFMNLFKKYDLTFIEDYQEVLDLIKNVMNSWKKKGQGTELVEVIAFDSKCLFCQIGKTLKAYKWSYQHKQALSSGYRVIYAQHIAFMFGFEEDRLVEFGTCNAFLKQEDLI